MNTRQAIQDYLKEHPFSYAEELSAALSTTRANIQYHLKRLAADGSVVQVSKSTAAADRGRPRSYYALSTQKRPDNLIQLADTLLRLYLDSQPEVGLDLEKLAALSAAILPPKAPISASTSRLNKQVNELTARGYQARWEAHARGPEIIFRNCPYAALIEKHPELCQMDTLLLNKHLGISLRQISKIQLPTPTACRFIIEASSASKHAVE